MVKHPHRALIRDSFMERYGWTFADFQNTPEWVIEEQLTAMGGIAEGAAARSSSSGDVSYAAGMTAEDLARRGGLPMPGGFGE